MTRNVDWKAKLIDYLAAASHRPFVFGSFDCAIFSFEAVEVMTGLDLHSRYRNRYSTLAGGIKLVRKDGFRDHVALMAAHFEEIAPSFAQAGDIAVVPTSDGHALGVVQGEYIYVLGQESLTTVSLLTALRAFRVT